MLSKFGVFSATMQLVMASDNGLTLDSATTGILKLVEREKAPGNPDRKNISHNVSNAMHTMVGLGAIKKEHIHNASIGAVFTWVGVNLYQAPMPPPPSATVHSRGVRSVRGPGVGLAAGSLPPPPSATVNSCGIRSVRGPGVGRAAGSLPPPPSASVHSRGIRSVRGPGVGRAAGSLPAPPESRKRLSALKWTGHPTDQARSAAKVRLRWSRRFLDEPTSLMFERDEASPVTKRARSRRTVSFSSQGASRPPRVDSLLPQPTAQRTTEANRDEDGEEKDENQVIGDERARLKAARLKLARLKAAHLKAAHGGKPKPEDTNAAVDKAFAAMQTANDVGRAAGEALEAAIARSGKLAEVTVDSAKECAEAATASAAATQGVIRAVRARVAALRRSADGAGAGCVEAREEADMAELVAVKVDVEASVAEQLAEEITRHAEELDEERAQALASSDPPAA